MGLDEEAARLEGHIQGSSRTRHPDASHWLLFSFLEWESPSFPYNTEAYVSRPFLENHDQQKKEKRAFADPLFLPSPRMAPAFSPVLDLESFFGRSQGPENFLYGAKILHEYA